MRVLIPTPLRSYTGEGWVEVDPSGTPPHRVGAVLDALEVRFPGLRFRMIDEQDRMRPHMRFFVRGRAVFDLAHPLAPGDELHIVQALSGG